jgi:hypothetical protein
MQDDAVSAERAEPELVAQIGPLLRARKDLTSEDVAYIESILQATVRRVRSLPQE